MNTIIDRINKINSNINDLNSKNKVNIIAVSKTFPLEHIMPLVEYGHIHFGENKVQEAIDKWTETKRVNPKIQLHMIGKLQTNKVKFAVKLFDYIHSVDNEKLIKKIADESVKLNKKIKIFIQVNIGNETQKSGVDLISLKNLILSCKEKNLDLLGLMCIPPINEDPIKYFKEMKKLNNQFNFSELSMGMSSDYLSAAKNSATFLRIGSSIFGERS